MTGQDFINNCMYDVGKYQVLTTDTALRVIVLSWANRVIKDVCSRHPHWVWLENTSTFNTVIDQLTYDLPSDIDLSGRKVFTVRQKTSPVKLVYVNQRRFDELESDPTISTGNPYIYTLWANQIRLWPVPSSVMTMYMRYMKRAATALTDSASSTTDIPEKFDEVILAGMRKFAFRLFPNWGNPDTQEVLYEKGITQMTEDNGIALDSDNISERHSIDLPSGLAPFHYDNTSIGS